jgi:folate-dependent phosphoribosylglycinamide formyltransferase PurN
MKLAIITSNHLRHHFFINQISHLFKVVGVLMEEKVRDPSQKGVGTVQFLDVSKYFNERKKSEELFFGHDTVLNIDSHNVIKVEAGHINDEKYVSILKQINPDYIIVFGSSILKDAIIDLFPRRIINMHLGLSPYYRGSATNFWPLYDNKLEYVGVTIHFLDKGIDSGRIILQGRPVIEPSDTPHSIGNKTIVKGTELMLNLLDKLATGFVPKGSEQNHQIGKLCLFKDYGPEHIIKVVNSFNNGIVREYLDKIKKQSVHEPKIIQSIQ